MQEGGLRIKGYFKETLPNEPLISIITIVYNCEKHIEQTIQSVINQTHFNVEYIIIDGGSTDGTLDIIKAYNDKIDYWISEPDDGISDAFNKGINISTGMMIGIINAGDWYELNTIELVASVIRVTDVDIVHGKLQYWHKEQQSEQVSGNHNFLDKDMTVNHMTVFIRRELLKKIGVFSTKFQYAMDYELLLRAVNYGASFFYIDMVLSNMRTEGKSHIGWRRALREVAYAKRLHSSAVLSPWVYYCYQLVKGSIGRIFHNIGLTRLVSFYHKRFSLVRKIATNKK